MEQLLQEVFGLNSFRDKQKEAIESILTGMNTLCLMPTGMGKSLIYQYIAVHQGKMALVFSPLLALMDQQRDGLNQKLGDYGLSVSFNSSLSAIQQVKYLTKKFNPPKQPAFLFISPEKALLDGYLAYTLKKYRDEIGLIVIDEAHCVSQWGHSFRPSYKMIPEFINSIFCDAPPPVLCLTATINNRDKEEIKRDFKIENEVVSDSLYRHNIELNILDQVKDKHQKKEELEKLLLRHKGEKIIVYTHIKRRDYGTREMSEAFKANGFNCAPFDADLSENDRMDTLDKFIKGDIEIIFATTAFGMGIDIPDIRCVVHYLIPESLEQYYQEVGRAGRDGKPAFAYLLHAEPNLRIKRDLIEKGEWSQEALRKGYENLLGQAGTKSIPYTGQLGTLDYGEENISLIVLLKLVEKGYATLDAKGFHDIRCFEEKKDDLQFRARKDLTRTGMVKLVAKREGVAIAQVLDDLYDSLINERVQPFKAPQKVLFYSIVKELDKQAFNEIKNDFDEVLKYKLDGLERLNEVLQGKMSIDTALEIQLGIQRSNDLLNRIPTT